MKSKNIEHSTFNIQHRSIVHWALRVEGWALNVFLILLFLSTETSAQILTIGRDPRDRFLPGFWTSTNNNASNAIAGLNANAPSGTTFGNNLLPSVMTSRTYSNGIWAGTFYGTNAWRLLSWDAAAANFKSYSIEWSNGVADTNTIVRHMDLTNVVRAMNVAGQSGATISTNFNPGQFTATTTSVDLAYGLLVTNLNTRGFARTGITYKTNDYTITTNDDLVLGDATNLAFTVFLPTAVSIAGHEFVIKKVDTNIFNNVTVDAAGTEKIDFSLTYVLSNFLQGVRVISDNTNWIVTGKF